jgi:glyoxylase-like metal-dependent hydrolase (beta-lactamase superfamily II)
MTAMTSPASFRSKPRRATRRAMSCFGSRMKGKRAVFCGDVIHHALQVYAPHWNHRADECPADAALSRRRLLESCAEQDALLFPIHFGAPHVARIEAGAKGFSARFAPETS